MDSKKKILYAGIGIVTSNILLLLLAQGSAIGLIIGVLLSIIINTAFTLSLFRFVIDPLEERLHWFRSMLDAIPQPVSVTDLEMNWTFVNKAATEPLGVTLDDVLGKQE